MRIRDARTGRFADIRPPRGSVLRVGVHTASTDRPFPLGDLRALVVADVLFRTAELDGVQVMVGYADGALPAAAAAAQTRELALLGIGPPVVHAEPDNLAEALGSPADIHVMAAGTGIAPARGGMRVAVGPVQGATQSLAHGGGADRLALRLALLKQPYARPVDLEQGTLDSARQELTRWRRHVASWAQAVSRPMHQKTAEQVRAALHEDLGSAVALESLARLESESGVPDGARFETFVHADRVLALELPRDIGRE